MKRLALATALLGIISVAPAFAESMVISENGTRPSAPGPAENFTGTVMTDRLYSPNDSTPNGGSYVAFSPSARTAWHTHPAGQVLVITDGTGWVQEEGGTQHQVKPGDVIWTPPGVKHWHGATATTSMRHIAISNMKDGKNVSWMEPVSDEQYRQ